MTCIVGVTDGKTVTIGGDSAGSDDWGHVAIRSDTKVFQVGPYVMGFTTSFRMGQLLRYSLEVEAPDSWDVDRFMATTFMNAVRTCLREGGFMKTESGQEQGGTFLVGVQGHLYVVDSDFQIGHTTAGYAAVGSGYMAALGALHATAPPWFEFSPRERVELALRAASDLTAWVRPPYTIQEAS
jgi:hypothetical protein